ncbi:MAG: branched-chain amino acid ABC transporter permease [Dehalococcoidia bacterium]|jgi:branched-chain amino acid transport system permease protein
MRKFLLNNFYFFKLNIFEIPWRMILFVCIIFLALIPLVASDYVMRILTFACLFAIFAASWDILGGYMGQLNMGHAAFFGVGAYVTALCNVNLGISPYISVLMGALFSVFTGLIVCLPALRLRGFYLALVTLAFPVVLNGVVMLFPDLTGGEMGISGLSRLVATPIGNYYIMFITMLISVFIMWKFTDTQSRFIRTGVIMRAIREDEIAARTSGINTTLYKVFSFAMSAFFAGLSGAMYAHLIRVAGPSTLTLTLSFNPILWSIFGSIGTVYGAVVGVFILYPLVELLRLNVIGEEIRIIVQALVLILVLLFMPIGLTTWIRDHIEVTCLRCKVINIFTRKKCRICGASLHLEKGGIATH